MTYNVFGGTLNLALSIFAVIAEVLTILFSCCVQVEGCLYYSLHIFML